MLGSDLKIGNTVRIVPTILLANISQPFKGTATYLMDHPNSSSYIVLKLENGCQWNYFKPDVAYLEKVEQNPTENLIRIII